MPSVAVTSRLRHLARRIGDRTGARSALGYDELIYLIGPTGFPNYGDELIAAAWLRYLARERPRAVVVVDCHSPGSAALLLRGIHPGAVFVDTLWQLARFAAKNDHDRESDTAGSQSRPDPQMPWRWVAQAVTDPGTAPRLSEGIDILNRATTIHLLGGGYLNSVWPQHVSLVVGAAAVGRRSGAQVIATGQGLLPTLDEPAWSALIEAADSFALFDVRDADSARAASGVRALAQSGDDAWLGLSGSPAGLYRAEGGDSPRVILCVQSDLTERFTRGTATGVDALAELVADTLDQWQVTGRDVTVVEGIPGHDNAVAHRLGDRLAGAAFVPFRGVWRHGLPAGRGDTWISTRFHPHLMAAAAGDSGIAVVAAPGYYSTKHRSLAESGSAWTILDDPNATPDRPDAGGFPTRARQRAIEAKLRTAEQAYPHSTAMAVRWS